jgi:hypothetical protein
LPVEPSQPFQRKSSAGGATECLGIKLE